MSGTGPDAAAGAITQGEVLWGIRRAFELVAAGRPVVLAFDDLHWADPALIELIGYLEQAEAPLLILGSARPEAAELAPALVERGERRLVLSLPPLTPAESEVLVAELLGAAEPPAGVASAMQAAAGNPLFLEETVHMLSDEGLLDTGAPLDSVPVPPSLRSMIGARLDRLPELERHLALRASVVGRTFWPGAVASLNGVGDDVEAALEALSALDVAEEHEPSMMPGEREFEFKHELIREVAYGRLPKGASRRPAHPLRGVDLRPSGGRRAGRACRPSPRARLPPRPGARAEPGASAGVRGGGGAARRRREGRAPGRAP